MKMTKLMICRLCLSQNVRMYSIENTFLQETYETLTNIQLTSDSGSRTGMGMACYVCYWLLQRSRRLQQQCLAHNVLVQLSHECRVEVTMPAPHRVNRQPYEWQHGLEQSHLEITDLTTLSPGNSDIVMNMKKEEIIEYGDTLPDAIGGTATETSEDRHQPQRVSVRDLITFEDDSNGSEQLKTQSAQETECDDDDDGAPPTKRLKLPETYEEESEDIPNTRIFEGNISKSESQESQETKIFFKNNKQTIIEPTNHVNDEAAVNNVRDSESLLQIINAETSVSETSLNEPEIGKESSKSLYYYCNNCEYRNVTKSALEKHMISHDESRTFSYNRAKLNSQVKYQLKDSKDKRFACNICTYKCTRKSYLKQHLLTHSGDKPFSCNICTYKCTQKSNLNRHLLTHSGDKPFSCNICAYKCTTKRNLKTHLLTHSADKPFVCNICTYKCIQKSKLKTHLLSHSGDKPFSCNICTYKCVQKSELKTHLLTHSGDKPFACNICGYKCTRKSTLKTHLLTHSGDKQFACNICTYKCTLKVSLKTHLLSHSGDKPFSCNICTYRCMQKGNLKNHLLTHSSDKPFSCNICTYKCIQKSNLKKHLFTHSGDKPFSCNICTYKCIQKSNLKKHLLTHSGNKPFACNICAYQCTWKDNLNAHIMTHAVVQGN